MLNIEELIEQDFSGCISIVKEETILFERNYGYSDLANQIKNKLNTKFATASAGKAFVAVAILQLVERGQLRLEDSIGSLLGFDLKKIDKKITIHQLLCHTSGIPDYFDESIMEEYDELWRDYPNYKIRSSSDLIPLFIDKPMMYQPGEKFQYNNTGYVVLGLIIEKVTGLLFDKYLHNNIFSSCSMSDTGYFELDRLPCNCANSYIYDKERNEYYTNIYSVDVKGTGAGGAFTTVLDINKFWKHLLDGKLISSRLLDLMLSVQSSTETEHYGYGMWLRKMNDNIYHPFFQGCDPGVSFISSYDTDTNLCITAVSNFGSNVWKLHRTIKNSILETI